MGFARAQPILRLRAGCDLDMIKIRAGFDIIYDAPQPTPKVLMLTVRPERQPDLLDPHRIIFEPEVPSIDYLDGFGNVCTRVVAPPGRFRLFADFVVADSGKPDLVVPDAPQAEVPDLPD